MKTITARITAVLLLLLGLAFAASAERLQKPATAAQIWTLHAGTASTATYTTVQKTDRDTKKQFVLVGYSSAGADQLATVLPGTAVIQTAPTASGPWVTAKDVNGNALSTTAFGTYTVDSLNQWYRVKFTKTATDTKSISAWLISAGP